MTERIDYSATYNSDFDEAEFYQSHFKTILVPKDSRFKSWDSPIEKLCEGSFFASVLQ